MKKFYEIGTVLQINGKNYEVVRGNGDDLYNTCGKCALYGGKPGTCLLSNVCNLAGTCSAETRPDGTDVHYELTDTDATVFYRNNGEEFEAPRTAAALQKPTVLEKEQLKNESDTVWLSDNDEDTEDATTYGETNNEIYSGEYIMEETFHENNKVQTPCKTETPKPCQPKIPITSNSISPFSIVKAKDENGNDIGGVLVTGENGNKYIMPYGSKVLMDGTCNFFSFIPNTLKYLTPFKDMNGNTVYTGDKLRIMTFGNNTREYVVKNVTCKKIGVAPLFYEEGNGSHSDDVKIVNNQVINGIIIGENDENEYIMEWFSSVKEALFKLIGSLSEFGNEELKTIYKLFNIEEFLKKTTIEN